MEPNHLAAVPLVLLALAVWQGNSDGSRQALQAQNTAAIGSEAGAAIEERQIEAQRADAERRFKSDVCYVTMQEIHVGLMPAQPIPEGSYVCSVTGTTAVVGRGGELTRIAKTTNQKAIRNLFQ